MLNCDEQVQIQKYKTHAYKTPNTARVQTIILKHPTKQKRCLSKKKKKKKKSVLSQPCMAKRMIMTKVMIIVEMNHPAAGNLWGQDFPKGAMKPDRAWLG